MNMICIYTDLPSYARLLRLLVLSSSQLRRPTTYATCPRLQHHTHDWNGYTVRL